MSRGFLGAVVIFAALVLGTSPAFAENEQQHIETVKHAFAAMHWGTGPQKLVGSHGIFIVPKDGKIALGSEAEHADMLLNGTHNSNVEGLAFLPNRTLYLSYADEGFVTADDWKNVNADEMLKSISDGTEQSNEERLKNGVSAMHVDGWIQKPTFDAERKSVRWIMNAHDANGKIVNAVALQLGRHGYERFTLVSDGSDPAGDTAILADAVDSSVQLRSGVPLF